MIQPMTRAAVVGPQGTASVVQPAWRRRSGWGVLAVGALVASMLAVAVVPAGAVTDRADHTTRLSACVAAAAQDRMFTDVSEGHAHRAAINCVAYYGITQGTGDGSTYSPGDEVTRAEMAVFIARAATAAGVALGSGIGGFNDIGGIWAEARDAINGLASRGMIRSGGDFRPHDAITRAEMAAFLIGLLDKASPNVTIDSSGAILLGAAGSRTEADDEFPDTSSAMAAALYELGVTKGASAAAMQDDSEPPLDFNYDPEATVDRGQMAAFITRALAHTSVRPAGVTAQYDGAEVVVSVRDRSYQPVPLAAVDVFWATAARAGRALLANGACRLSAVTQADKSSFPCEIDDDDPVTGRGGDVRVSVAGLRTVPVGGAVVWAWTGQNEDTLDASADVYRLEVAEGAGAHFATTTIVTTTFDALKVPFGGAVRYSLQLTDPAGNVHRGVDGVEPARWTLSVNVTGRGAPEPPDDETVVSDSAGRAFFTVPFRGTFDDPRPAISGDEFTVTFALIPARNAPPGFATVDPDGVRATSGTLIFSDEAPTIATVTIDTPDYIHVSGRGDVVSNRVTVTVRDQYGKPVPGATARLRSSGAGVTLDSTGTVDSDGSRQFSYRYSGTGRVTETLTADASATGSPGRSQTKRVYWTVDAELTGSGSVLAGDVDRRHIVVDDSGPVLLVYDRNDVFNLRGAPASMADFEAELAADLRRASPSLSLSWENYATDSTRRVVEYDLG